jgi:hypothetical protein
MCVLQGVHRPAPSGLVHDCEQDKRGGFAINRLGMRQMICRVPNVLTLYTRRPDLDSVSNI